MKKQRSSLISFLRTSRRLCRGLSAAGLFAFMSAPLFAASGTWDGGAGGTGTDLTTAVNWTGDIGPTDSGDTATWSGVVAGNLSLTWNSNFGGGTPSGTNLNITGANTGNLTLRSLYTGGNTTSNFLQAGDITIASGAGALTIGDGLNNDNVVFRNPGGITTNTLTNNSSNTATFASNVRFNSGGGATGRSVIFTGSGNWQVSSIWALGGVGDLVITKNGSGTMTVTSANTVAFPHTITGGTFVAGNATALGSGNITINGGTLSSSVASATGVGNVALSSGGLNLNGSGVGILALASGKTFGMTGGTWSVSVASTSSYDQVTSAGGAVAFGVANSTIALSSVPNYSVGYSLLSGFASGTVSNLSITGYDTINYTASLGTNGVLNFTAIPGGPTNNMFASRTTLTGLTPSATGTNVGATPEPGEPAHAGVTGGKSVWWTWTAPATVGEVVISTAGSNFNTTLGVYTGTSVSALTLVEENDDFDFPASQVSFRPTPGATYQIAVDGANGATGNIALALVFTASPANDAFSGRITLTGTTATTTGSNVAASAELDEPQHAGIDGGRSVWWTWTAPSSGTVTITTAGSASDTLLAVYTGSAVNALTSVVANDNNPAADTTTSRVVFNAVSGTTYQIAVDSPTGISGSITLGLTLGALVPAPANNAFASRTTLTGLAPSATGTNVGATRETGEPAHAAGVTGGKTVWWTWTAPATVGEVVVTTLGSDFNTTLGVYTGTAVSALTLVDENDDFLAETSQVSFRPSAGTTYQIAVDGADGATGNIALALVFTASPANDAFSGRITLTGTTATTTGSNMAASTELDEPQHAGIDGGRSVWWKWTAPSSGTVTITTAGSASDTLLAVYTGSAVNALTSVVANDNNPAEDTTTSRVVFNAVSGTTYQIAVDSPTGISGSITLGLTLGALVPAPANNAFASRTTLTGLAPSATGTNVGATRETGEPAHAAGVTGGKTVWWTWTAPATVGEVVVTTAESDFNTTLGVYTGTAVGSLTLVDENDDFLAETSQVSFRPSAGTTYQIAVDGADGATGNIALALVFTASPANDAFSGRITLTGTTATTTGSNVAASAELDEPQHADVNGGRSVWWTWTAPSSGTVTIRTDGSGFDTVLGVYTGTSVSTLTPVASNNDFGDSITSLVRFAVVPGTAYRIAVDGLDGGAGNIALSVVLTPPITNDSFAGRSTLSGSTATVNASNIGATKEASEPNHANGTGGASAWWTWTAPQSGTVTISTAGSDFDTLLGVYTGSAVGGLTLVAANDQDPAGGITTSRVVFNVTSGTVYQIAVDGADGANGYITLNINLGALVAAPGNDTFANRATLTSASPGSGTNLGATRETGEPPHAADSRGGHSVWWTWTATSSGTVAITTAGTGFNTTLGVYTGGAVNALTLVAENDDAHGAGTSRVTFAAVSGTTYQIAVDGYDGATGGISLRVILAPFPPNDNFSASEVFTGATIGISEDGSKEVGEPDHAGSSGSSLWWVWTAPSNGPVTISTAGSDFDTVLAVYTGTALNNLVEVASNDDSATSSPDSEVSFQAISGTVYHIAVDGFGGASGLAMLSLNQVGWIAPTITTQPVDATVTTGGVASFTAQATGTPSPTYQWQRSVNSGGSWSNVVEGAPFTGASSSTLTVNPATSAQEGNLFRCIATNSEGTATSNVAGLALLSTYASFQEQYFTPSEITAGTITGPTTDPDGDGLNNLMEYAFKLNPRTPDVGAAPGFSVVSNHLRLTYVRRNDVADLTYTVEVSGDLQTWNSGPAFTGETGVVGLDSRRDQVTVQDNTATTSAARRFMRLRITKS